MRTLSKIIAQVREQYLVVPEADYKESLLAAIIICERAQDKERESGCDPFISAMIQSNKLLLIDALRREWNFA